MFFEWYGFWGEMLRQFFFFFFNSKATVAYIRKDESKTAAEQSWGEKPDCPIQGQMEISTT